MLRGNKSLYAKCGSKAQHGCHAHKCSKMLLLQNRWADFHETWYVVSGTPAQRSLFKLWPKDDLDQFYSKVSFGNLGLYMGKCENNGSLGNYCSLRFETWQMQTTNEVNKGLHEYSRSFHDD